MLIIKAEKLKLNKRTKLLAQHQKSMLKKELEMRDTQVEKHPFLLEVVLLMVQKVRVIIRLEN